MKKSELVSKKISSLLEGRKSQFKKFQYDTSDDYHELRLFPTKKEAYESMMGSALFEKKNRELIFTDDDTSLGILTKYGEQLYFVEGERIPVSKFPRASEISGIIINHVNGVDFWPLDKVHIIVDDSDKDLKNVRIDFDNDTYIGEHEINWNELPDA